MGEKVADCILLFGLDRDDAFPVDVWVRRLMEEWFGVTGTPSEVRTAANRLFGSRAGVVQQYLFHAARTGAIPV